MRRELAERVSGMVLIPDMEDKLCWANDKNEEFLVKKCSELLILDGGVDIKFACDKLWKLKVPLRVRSFLWMLAIDRIPSKEFLVKRGVNLYDISVSCPWIDTIISNSAACFWWPPPYGWLKFNVCGVAKEDRAGYGGVLINKEDVARALFFCSVAANDADMAETGAVKMALEVMRPWSRQAIFAGIHIDMLKARNVAFSVSDEKGNELASSLVIAGFNRENMFKAWW
ncbi:hypothetical protein Gotur_008027 [Gossypium turneri]